MNRLTNLFCGQNKIYGYEGITCSKICSEREYCSTCIIQGVINKLSKYEDSGMDPEEVSAMMAHNTVLVEQLKDYETIDPDIAKAFENYVGLYDAIHTLQNGGILDEEEVQICEHNLLFQIVGMMHSNILGGRGKQE